jgi:hypothetical protein
MIHAAASTAAMVMTATKALAQLITEPAIHAAVSTAAIEIKATKSAAGMIRARAAVFSMRWRQNRATVCTPPGVSRPTWLRSASYRAQARPTRNSMRLRDAMQRAMALVGDEQGKGGHVGFSCACAESIRSSPETCCRHRGDLGAAGEENRT